MEICLRLSSCELRSAGTIHPATPPGRETALFTTMRERIHESMESPTIRLKNTSLIAHAWKFA